MAAMGAWRPPARVSFGSKADSNDIGEAAEGRRGPRLLPTWRVARFPVIGLSLRSAWVARAECFLQELAAVLRLAGCERNPNLGLPLGQTKALLACASCRRATASR